MECTGHILASLYHVVLCFPSFGRGRGGKEKESKKCVTYFTPARRETGFLEGIISVSEGHSWGQRGDCYLVTTYPHPHMFPILIFLPESQSKFYIRGFGEFADGKKTGERAHEVCSSGLF